MSVYPKFKSSSVFNSSSIIGNEDGIATVKLDLSSFVQRSAAVFDDSVYLKDGVSLNWNGVLQESAYDNIEKQTNANNKEKLTNIEFDNTTTKITSTLDLIDSTLLLTDETIGINKITNLTSTLVGIQDNLNNIQNNDIDILALQNNDITHEDRLDSIDTLTSAHTTNLLNIEMDIVENIKVDISTNILSLSSNLASIINNLTLINNNESSINLNISDIVALQNSIVSIESDITANLLNLNSYKILTDAELLNLENQIISNDNDILNIQNNVTAIDITNSTQADEINALEILTTTHSTEISNIETLNTTQNSNISALEMLTAAHTSNLTTLDGSTASSLSSITSLQTQQGINNSYISTLQTDIITKHPNITGTARLNASYLGNGDVSNDKLSALNDISTIESIQTQINNVKSDLAVIDGLQDLDLLSIPLI